MSRLGNLLIDVMYTSLSLPLQITDLEVPCNNHEDDTDKYANLPRKYNLNSGTSDEKGEDVLR